MLLIVDDDPEFLEQAKRILDAGRGVFFASGARQAKDLLDHLGSGVSVALVDLDLPGEDGFTLIRELHRRSPYLPIIAISGVLQPSVLESARSFGAVETLRKPVTESWNAVIDSLRVSR